MILGLDFWGTVSDYPVALRKLAQVVLDSGGEVHLVTAVLAKNDRRVRQEIRDSRIPCTSLSVLHYTEYNKIAELKVPVYQKLGCDIVVEDNEITVTMLKAKRICALQI